MIDDCIRSAFALFLPVGANETLNPKSSLATHPRCTAFCSSVAKTKRCCCSSYCLTNFSPLACTCLIDTESTLFFSRSLFFVLFLYFFDRKTFIFCLQLRLINMPTAADSVLLCRTLSRLEDILVNHRRAHSLLCRRQERKHVRSYWFVIPLSGCRPSDYYTTP